MTILTLTIIGLITWLLVPNLNAWLDRKGPVRIYLPINILRGIAMVVHSVIFFDPQGGYAFFSDLWKSIPYLVFYFGSYWLNFEIVLNILTGRVKNMGWKKGLLYYDNKEGNSGIVDKFFKWAGNKAHTVAKIITLVLTIASIIFIIYKHL